jgi:hypothetical protein
MVVSLPYTEAEFDSSKQDDFRAGVASAADVSVSKVEITAIRAVTSRRSASRRLLATSVEVRPSCQPRAHAPHLLCCDTTCSRHIRASRV